MPTLHLKHLPHMNTLTVVFGVVYSHQSLLWIWTRRQPFVFLVISMNKFVVHYFTFCISEWLVSPSTFQHDRHNDMFWEYGEERNFSKRAENGHAIFNNYLPYDLIQMITHWSQAWAPDPKSVMFNHLLAAKWPCLKCKSSIFAKHTVILNVEIVHNN